MASEMTHCQFRKQGFNKLVILGEKFQHLFIARQVDQHSQCILRNWLYKDISRELPPMMADNAQCNHGLEASNRGRVGVDGA
jgi:hypothetical protein